MSVQKTITSKDFLLGLVYIVSGILYGGYALRDLPLGTALNMGPGYFPIWLCGFLIIIGLIIAFRSLGEKTEYIDFRTLPWRGIFAISLSVVVFALLARGAGLVISTIVASIIAAWAARTTTWYSAILTAVFLAVFSTAVFVYGMQLPLGVFGVWFR